MLVASNQWQTEKEFDLSQAMLRTLTLLYQPLIGEQALVLYLTLFCKDRGSHQQLNELLNLDLPAIERARIKLEELGLLRTYLSFDNYLYVLLPPLNYDDFLYHEVYGRLLLSVMGQEYYRQSQENKPTYDKGKLTDITAKLDKSFLNKWTDAKERIFSNKKMVTHDLSFDQIELFSGISDLSFPYDLRTPHTISLIFDMADIYNVPLAKLKEIIKKSFDEENYCFNEQAFKQWIRNLRPPKKTEKHPYDKPALQYLADLQNSGNIADPDKKTIEKIKEKFNQPDEVINVIIEHVLKTNNMDFHRGIAEGLAGTFDRMKITDYQSALRALEKVRSYNREVERNKTPDWINRNPVSKSGKIEDEEFDEKEFVEAMKELGKYGD